jgi:hypothetical protein
MKKTDASASRLFQSCSHTPGIDRAYLPPPLNAQLIQVDESWRGQSTVLAGKLPSRLILHVQSNNL